MASHTVVLKIKKDDKFVNAEKNTDDDKEEHPGTVTYNVDDETLAEYKYRPEGGEEKIQYFRKQDDETWKRYLDGIHSKFDNNDGVDNIFKFENPSPAPVRPLLRRQNAGIWPQGAADQHHHLLAMGAVPVGAAVGVGPMNVEVGGSRKKSKSKKSKRKTKGGKKQKKQSKSRKQRR
jgi:hypothetical protein